MDKYVLFVCTGNTCRSPMGATIAKSIFEEHNINAQVYSAGVSAWNGQPASNHAVTVMNDMDLDLTQHISQSVSPKLLANATVIFTMTAAHLAAIQDYCPVAKTIALNVSDPFGGSLETYRKTAIEIKDSIIKNLEDIKKYL